MASIRSKDTKPELALRRHLYALGLRYRLHDRRLPGTPDIVFPRSGLAVFVDGDFWHGRAGIPRSNREFWKRKFRANRLRDRKANRALRGMGWDVVRLRERDVMADPRGEALVIYAELRGVRAAARASDGALR